MWGGLGSAPRENPQVCSRVSAGLIFQRLPHASVGMGTSKRGLSPGVELPGKQVFLGNAADHWGLLAPQGRPAVLLGA